MLDPVELVHFFVSLFVITNAFGNLGFYIGLMHDKPFAEQKQNIRSMMMTLAVTFLLLTWGGDWVLTWFGITLPGIQIAGGIVLTLIGVSMLNPSESSMIQHTDEQNSIEDRSAVGVVPLAIPIIGGPGAFTIIMESVHQYGTLAYKFAFSLIDIAIILFVGIVFYFANYVQKILGHSGVLIATRLMGLILVAVASDMMIDGIREALF